LIHLLKTKMRREPSLLEKENLRESLFFLRRRKPSGKEEPNREEKTTIALGKKPEWREPLGKEEPNRKERNSKVKRKLLILYCVETFKYLII